MKGIKTNGKNWYQRTNRKTDTRYVKKVALKDFQRPFLHQAKFFPFQVHTGIAGQVRFPRDNPPVMELYARHFASPRFIKTVRHELIHYFLFMDKKPHGHNKEFKEWSCRVDAGTIMKAMSFSILGVITLGVTRLKEYVTEMTRNR